MAQEQRSSPPKVLEWIANNTFLNAITETPLRKAITVGVGGATLLYIILSLAPQYREYLNQTQHPEALKLAVSATAIPIGIAASLATDYLRKLVEYASSMARQAYTSYRNR